jgi:hypothetical protein
MKPDGGKKFSWVRITIQFSEKLTILIQLGLIAQTIVHD